MNVKVYGAWIHDYQGAIPREPWPVEGARLVRMIPGKFNPDNLPGHVIEAARGYVLAIGLGDRFRMIDLRLEEQQ
jgi:hypothetical protein